MEGQSAIPDGLNSINWKNSYKTSASLIGESPIDILQDFYIPALQRAISYDRMAGYFRSSSLAAASQGFTAFIGRKGRMRLIVGCDLAGEDVKAILEGDEKRLAASLNRELEEEASWPEDVRNGVILLAWMVARGYLEVRVAFRKHAETGEPLTMTAIEDGYVHEKWAIFQDESGNRLYCSGSLNESLHALVKNAENVEVHCDWWGERDCQRVDEAAAAFENVWGNFNPCLQVLTLPEAVHRRLLEIAEEVDWPQEIDGSSASPKEIPPPTPLELLRFAIIRDGPQMPGGRFVGMETAPVDPWPHQSIVARRLIETWPYSYLLCDAVGLGKTIETALAMRSLYLSGIAKRILIAAPANLTRQWQREMASKLLMSFGLARTSPYLRHSYIFPLEEDISSRALFDPDLTIVSTGLIVRQERTPEITSCRRFDVVLVDEAHAARRKNPTRGTEANAEFGQLYKVLRDDLRKQSKSLWLATATPMQLHPVEVFDLISLANRVSVFQFDPTLMVQYYEILGKLIRSVKLEKYEWDFLQKSIKMVAGHDPLLWNFFNQSVIDGRIRATLRKWLEKGVAPKGKDIDLMVRLIFAASPLSRVMMRHTRSLLEIYRDNNQLGEANLPQRKILPVPRIVMNELERRAYDYLEKYCQGLKEQIETHSDAKTRQSMGFFLSFLRLRFASSLFAIHETLKRRLEKVEATLGALGVYNDPDNSDEELTLDYFLEGEIEDDKEVVASILKNRSVGDLEWEREELKKMLEQMADFTGPSTKMTELLNVLNKRRIPGNGRINQTVIFTRFYDTLSDIVNRLLRVNPSMRIGTYSGRGGQYLDPVTNNLLNVDREEVKHRFLRDEIDILVCTDAAAEGLNLQTADLLINFDLGWNPMKIEQRIGRIDRIGQKHKNILVLNLCYLGSAEEIVYNRLFARLSKTMGIVGTQQISMLPIELEEFVQLADGTLKEETLFNKAKERLNIQQQRTQSMELPPQALYEIYQRLTNSSVQSKPPVTLDAIWEALASSEYLRNSGCDAISDKKGKRLILKGLNEVPRGTILTTTRRLYEEGIPGSDRPIHFASYGDFVFDAILKHLGQFKFPVCIKRLTAKVDGLDNVYAVAFAVVCLNEEGLKEIRLITSWDELEGLKLLEEAELSEEDIQPLLRRLKNLADDEFKANLAADRVEKLNINAGLGQLALINLIAIGFLSLRLSHSSENENFWIALKDATERLQKKDEIRIPNLPANVVRKIKSGCDLIFEPTIPSVGNDALIDAPKPLIQTSLDLASRTALALKVKKADLRTENVISRMRRDVAQILAKV